MAKFQMTKVRLLTVFFTLSAAACSSSKSGSSSDLGSANSQQPVQTLTSKAAGAQLPRLIRSDYQKGELTQLCASAIERIDQRVKAIAAMPAAERTIDNTLLAYEAASADLSDDVQPLTFMSSVSTDSALSDEALECQNKLNDYLVDLSTRRDLYAALKDAKARTDAEARLLDQTLLGFKQNGMDLSDQDLAQLRQLKMQLAAKETTFSNNLDNDKSSVVFSADELTGAPQDFLARLKKTADGKFIVTTKSTDYSTVMDNVSVSKTRHQMLLAYLNRGGEANTRLLEEAVALRSQIAKLLGYSTWADYRIAPRMAKSKENVLKFLGDLKTKLAARDRQDMAQLLAFKKELEPSATSLDQWDIIYLSNQLQKRDYSVDEEKIREYFPADLVVNGMFAVYSKMLGVTYKEVQDAKVWADGVKLYEIHDQSDDHLIGFFYTDFIPREGKYGHAAAFPLISGRVLPDGRYSYPVASIVANFTPPSGNKPSLMTHDEVSTVFHEFGHIMHQTLTRAPYASLSGSSTAQDFVEAPSQMLENWVWQPEILAQISGHYLDHSQKLPTPMLDKMLAARDFQQGYMYTKQLLYALFDMTIHTQEGPVDVTKTFNDMYRDFIGVESIPGGHFAASFGHLMGGYDAGYYGYLWSEVYAQDMFSIFEAQGIASSVVGDRYRRVILENGNMKDAIDLLREFLGREPNQEAFFRKLKGEN